MLSAANRYLVAVLKRSLGGRNRPQAVREESKFTIRYFWVMTRLPRWERWRPKLGNNQRNGTGPGNGEFDSDRFETATAGGSNNAVMGWKPQTPLSNLRRFTL